jgi:hypothetical protein
MGIFYNAPPPPTASNAGTPPEPHVPIATRGSQPPRYTTALMLVAVLASWPQDLEPRLQRPNDLQRTKIAPLTLTYGQQPPRYSVASLMNAAVAAWPPDLEPRLGRPNNQQQQIAPLTLKYGQQPPLIGDSVPEFYKTVTGAWPIDLEPRLQPPNNRQQSIAPLTRTYGDQPAIIGASAVIESTIVASWPADLEPRLGLPNNAQQKIAPLTLVYGAAPPVVGTTPARAHGVAIGAWPPDLEPRLAAPNNVRVSAAPLTLVYGSQPVPTPALNLVEFQTILASTPPDWPAQSAPKSVAWFTPPATATKVAFPYGLILANWPLDLEPRLTRPNDAQQKIATLTLPTGQAPPPQAPLSVAELTAISAPTTTWDAQSASKNAAWNVPVVTQVPFAPFPRSIRAAWDEPWIRPPVPVAIAPLTLSYGAPPPSRPALSITIVTTTVAAWAQPSDAQSPPKNAWNTPLFAQVPYATQPLTIRAAWDVATFPLPRLVTIAPLTLQYGQPPPVIGDRQAFYAQVVGQWPPDLEPRPAPSLEVRPQSVALSLSYGAQPPRRAPLLLTQLSAILQWQPVPNAAQTAGHGVGVFLIYPAIVRFIDSVLRAAQMTELALDPAQMMNSVLLPAQLTELAGGGYLQTVLSDQPFSYWRLDNAGATMTDLVGGRNGVNSGNVATQQPGVTSDGDTSILVTNGSGGVNPAAHVEAAGLSVLSGTSTISLEAWFQIGPASFDPFSAMTILSFDDPSNSLTGGEQNLGVIWMPANGSVPGHWWVFGEVVVTLSDASIGSVEADTQFTADGPMGPLAGLETGKWVHVVFTFDGTLGILYVNGVRVSSDVPFPTPGPATLLHGDRVWLGAQIWPNDGPGWTGLIDEVAIYTTVLTAADVAAHYAAVASAASTFDTAHLTTQMLRAPGFEN